MYKLFLCLKYLRRRYMAIIAALAVALCVAMVLIVVSVMDGFLRQVEISAKGLYGDIVVDSTSLLGIGRYDQFISKLTGEYHLDGHFALEKLGDGKLVFRAKAPMRHQEALNETKLRTWPARAALFRDGRRATELLGTLSMHKGDGTDETLTFTPQNVCPGESIGPPAKLGPLYVKVGEGMGEIQAATPAIYTPGLLRIGTNFTIIVQIFGIRLPERLAVTDFAGGLFVQAGQDDANFDPSLEQMQRRVAEHGEWILEAIKRETALPEDRRDMDMIRRLEEAAMAAASSMSHIGRGLSMKDEIARKRRLKAIELAKPEKDRDKDKIARLTKSIDDTDEALAEQLGTDDDRVILGLGIPGLSFRTPEGKAARLIGPGRRVLLTLWPMGRGRYIANVRPSSHGFIVADDAKTGVHQFDSKTVYVPFEHLQRLAAMDELRDLKDPTLVDPARCSQIQIKVKPKFTTPRKLLDVRTKVRDAWRRFEAAHGLEAAAGNVIVHTWREKLAKFIGPIQKQRTLVAMMFGVISLVAVLLVFAIFYMIVMQKIRDIGIIRAVGGSPGGVAQIFLLFGAATGVVGSIVGLTVGWLFVHYINEVEDLLYLISGERIWDKEVFIFDKIPNRVEPGVMAVIAAWAIASGLVGALIPAIWAAIRSPAEVVRYE